MIQNFLGVEGFYWFTGVVEDRQDPMKLGRVRVRILGLHTEAKALDENSGQGIPTDKLPWAFPMMPITSASMNGIGQTPIGPVEGTHVVGFSRDGELFNDLVIMGTLGGVPQEASSGNIGFQDPSGTYPKSDHVGEADTNRLSRNEKISETINTIKSDGEDKSIPTANGTGEWSELPTPYNGQYPFNHVHETESGHVIERDDTSGYERLHNFHRTGTFDEVHPDGSKVQRIVKDSYEITHGDNFVHIKGRCDVTVDGDTTLFVKANQDKEVDGNVKIHIHGNVEEEIDGNLDQTVHGNVTLQVDGDVDETIGGNVTQAISGNVSSDIQGKAQLTIAGGLDVNTPITAWIGDININGLVTVTDDVIANGISLVNHLHSGVLPGPAPTGKPI